MEYSNAFLLNLSTVVWVIFVFGALIIPHKSESKSVDFPNCEEECSDTFLDKDYLFRLRRQGEASSFIYFFCD